MFQKGFWPLSNVEDYTPYQSGSLTWLLLGGNSTDPLSLVNMSTIPDSALTFNESGWFDLIANQGIADAHLTQLASVIVCPPNIRYTPGHIRTDGGSYRVHLPDHDEEDQSGQIDHTGAQWVFGLGLNGIPYDTIMAKLPLYNSSGTNDGFLLMNMSQIVFELMMQPPSAPGGATVQDLSDISQSLNYYMSTIGSSVFLSGDFGNMNVTARLYSVTGENLQFENSWLYWLASLAVMVIATILLIFIIALRGDDDNMLTIRKVIYEAKHGSFD